MHKRDTHVIKCLVTTVDVLNQRGRLNVMVTLRVFLDDTDAHTAVYILCINNVLQILM